MSTIHRYRSAFLGIVAVLSVVLVAPVAAQAPDQEQNLAAAPAGPSWDETSGYGAVEANRALIGHDDVVSGSAATGHEVSAALVPSWDAMSGYGAVEAIRSARALPVVADDISNQVPPDARWAPVPAFAPTAKDLGTALAVGTRAESAHLATISLPGGQ